MFAIAFEIPSKFMRVLAIPLYLQKKRKKVNKGGGERYKEEE